MRYRLWIIGFALIAGLSTSVTRAQQTIPLQHIWEVQPDFGEIWQKSTPHRVILFDIEALKSTQVQERVHVAQMICREHDNPNLQNRERALELLLERLQNGNEEIQVRRAMMSAACLLSDGGNAATLWSLVQSDSLIQSTVEKSLVKWKSQVGLDVWRKRLEDPNAKPAEIATALDGLAVTGGSEDRQLLERVLLGNQTTPANRHLGARVLGELNNAGLNELANKVIQSDVEHRHVLAGNLLRRHGGQQTQLQLRTIMTEGESVAQLVAAQALVENFPETAREFAPIMVAHADSPMRLLALNLLHTQTDEASLRLQAKLLSDRNMSIRRLAGTQLVEKAGKGQRAVVDASVTEHLNSGEWTGIEQAIIVSTAIQDRSRCTKLVELLEHPRPEVKMHAGWGLMELAQEPPILAGIEVHDQHLTAKLARGESLPLTDLICLSFLHEALGRNRYESAEPMLMLYVPKDDYKMGSISRASAIWALGQLNKNKDNSQLRQKLCERLGDQNPIKPEDYLVRFSCILAMGEMGYADVRETIIKYGEQIPTPLGYASDWAIKQIDHSGK